MSKKMGNVLTITNQAQAVIALSLRGRVSKEERRAIIQAAAKYVPIMAKQAKKRDKKAGLI